MMFQQFRAALSILQVLKCPSHKKFFYPILNAKEKYFRKKLMGFLVFDSRILQEYLWVIALTLFRLACILLCSNCLQPALRAWWKQVRPVKNQFSGFFTGTCPTGLYLGVICWNLHCENPSVFTGKEFIPVTFLSYTCNYYNWSLVSDRFYALRDFEVYWFYRQLCGVRVVSLTY